MQKQNSDIHFLNEKQLSLDLGYITSYERENLIVSRANCAAVELIDHWPMWPTPITVLIGGKGAGKSHLAHIWQNKTDAFQQTEFDDAVDVAMSGRCVLIENIDQNPLDEIKLFHLINAVWQSYSVNRRCSLLLTARSRPSSWRLTIADLISRLRVVNMVEIGSPDDWLLRGVLVKLLSDRQLVIEAHLVDYIVSRVERSLWVLNALVDQLDQLVVDEKSRLSRPLIARAFAQIEKLTVDF